MNNLVILISVGRNRSDIPDGKNTDSNAGTTISRETGDVEDEGQELTIVDEYSITIEDNEAMGGF